MRRVALLVEYDGTAYQGLQRQTHAQATIQGKIEEAARVMGSHEPRFIAAGRTDSGVHAVGQVIALDMPDRMEERRLVLAFNSLLPFDIRVRRGVFCDPDFSPRHDALMRSYLYRLCAAEPVPPLFRNFVAKKFGALDPELTINAAKCFIGKWEMKEWRSSICQATRTQLTITKAEAMPPGRDGVLGYRPFWQFRFSARSFLHHQVRFMVGGIASVGQGKISLEELREALAAGKRPIRAAVEPANGLTFLHVEYPPERNPFPGSNTDGHDEQP